MTATLSVFLQRGAHRGLDTGTCSGCPAAVARSCVHDNLCFMVSRECASACTFVHTAPSSGASPSERFLDRSQATCGAPAPWSRVKAACLVASPRVGSDSRPMDIAKRGRKEGETASTAVRFGCSLFQRVFRWRLWNTWSNWLPWALLAGALFFAITNVPYMARGMRQYEALFMVTVFQARTSCQTACPP